MFNYNKPNNLQTIILFSISVAAKMYYNQMKRSIRQGINSNFNLK